MTRNGICSRESRHPPHNRNHGVTQLKSSHHYTTPSHAGPHKNDSASAIDTAHSHPIADLRTIEWYFFPFLPSPVTAIATHQQRRFDWQGLSLTLRSNTGSFSPMARLTITTFVHPLPWCTTAQLHVTPRRAFMLKRHLV